MPVVRAANAEPLPGYRLLAPLGKGGFGEVWKCQAPGGFLKAIKFVGGTTNALHGDESQAVVRQEMRALQLLKTLRHPFLLSVERVEVIDGELLILTELADCSLQDLLERYQQQGQAGIPRQELLEYFLEAAEVLDVMNQEHGLQHLDIKPRNLFLSGRHIKVGDFGLVGSLAELYGPEGQSTQLEMVSPLYAAPERFSGKVSLYSDQYSLAISYVELLTGRFPFAGKNFRALAMQHLQEEPDLGGLPETDRDALRKGLAKDPRQRFPSCLSLLHTLFYPGAESTRQLRVPRPIPQPDQETARQGDKETEPGLSPPTELCLPAPQSLEETPSQDRTPTHQVRTVRETEGQREKTVPPSLLPSVPPSPDPLDGWMFLDCLGRFPYGEFWRVRPPAPQQEDGDRLVKLVFGFEPRRDRSGRDPLDRLRHLSHPALLPTEFIPTPGRLVIRAPWQGRTLVERFEEARAAGQGGIPREELLTHLGAIADALDTLRETSGLMHLGLNPRSLILDEEDAIRLADFGHVQVVWLPAGQNPAVLNPRYAAPELFASTTPGAVAPPNQHSDQYSLALIFVELLTGAHPLGNLSQRQMATARTRGSPQRSCDLSMTPGRDRPILTTALEADPRYRFGSCRELIDALAAASPSQGQRRSPGLRQATTPLPPLLRPPALNRVLRQLTEQAAGALQVHEFGQQRYLLVPGEMVSHHCFARLVASTAPLKLAGFREQWHARPVREEACRFQYQVLFPPNFLERCLGRQPGLETVITIEESAHTGATLTPVHIEIRPLSCGRARAAELLEEVAPILLDSLRNFLQAAPERRKQERFLLDLPVTIYPLLEGELGEGLAGQTYDVSLTGLGVSLPRPLDHDTVAVHLRTLGPQGVLVEGQIVRRVLCRDGRTDLGLSFGELPPS